MVYLDSTAAFVDSKINIKKQIGISDHCCSNQHTFNKQSRNVLDDIQLPQNVCKAEVKEQITMPKDNIVLKILEEVGFYKYTAIRFKSLLNK
jgi:hypothetical protein